jgi:hypothetical protein
MEAGKPQQFGCKLAGSLETLVPQRCWVLFASGVCSVCVRGCCEIVRLLLWWSALEVRLLLTRDGGVAYSYSSAAHSVSTLLQYEDSFRVPGSR